MIEFGEASVLIDGQPAARIGDPFVCPGTSGTVLHVGGNITSGSSTVVIGNAYAARMGDKTSCGTVGMTGIGLPVVRGPQPPGNNPANDEFETFEEESVEYGTVEAGHFWCRDTGYDHYYGKHRSREASISHLQQTYVMKDGTELTTTVDSFYAQGDYNYGAGAGGVGSQGSMLRIQEEIVNPDGDTGVATLSFGNYEIAGHALLGDDGRRRGVMADMGAQVSVAEAQRVVTTNFQIPFTDYNLQVADTVGGSVGSIGALGRIGAFHDRADDRFHVLALADADFSAGLKLGLDISIGENPDADKESDDDDSSTVQGMGVEGTPGLIGTGCSSVLIG
jgi:uncharacterized Zn-binding protein involved in type VI secretion